MREQQMRVLVDLVPSPRPSLNQKKYSILRSWVKPYQRYERALFREIKKNLNNPNYVGWTVLAALSMSSKSSGLGLIKDRSESCFPTLDLYYSNLNMFIGLAIDTKAVAGEFGKLGRESYGVISEMQSEGRRLGKDFLPGPAHVLEEASMVTAFLYNKNEDTEELLGIDRGGIRGLRRMLEERRLRVLLLSMPEKQRDQALQLRIKLAEADIGKVPEILSSAHVVEDMKNGREIQEYYRSKTGNVLTKLKSDRDLQELIFTLIQKKIIRSLYFEDMTLDDFRFYWQRHNKNQWTEFLDRYYYPCWIESMGGKNIIFVPVTPLGPQVDRYELRKWSEERSILIHLKRWAQESGIPGLVGGLRNLGVIHPRRYFLVTASEAGLPDTPKTGDFEVFSPPQGDEGSGINA